MHLPLCEFVLRVRGQARVVDARHLRLMLQPLRQVQRVAAVAFHAQGQGFHAAQGEEGVERPGNRADRVLQKTQALGQFRIVPDHRDATDHIGVAVQVLGGRVHHDVETQLQRALDPWAGKGVIGDTDNASRAADAGNGSQVNQAQQGIARGLDQDHFCVVLQRRFEGTEVGQVDEAEAMPGAALTDLVEQAKGTAVQVVARHHMGISVEQFQYRGKARQPGGKGKRAGAAFKVGDAALQGKTCRVMRAAIVKAFVHAGALLQISGVGVDRRHQRAGGRVRRLPGMDHPCSEGAGCAGFIVLTHARDLRK